MESPIWARSDDGSIKYVSVTKDTLKDTLMFVREALYMHENLCKSLELSKHPDAIAELDAFTILGLRDGFSIIAVEIETNKVIGCMISKININNSDSKSLHEICKCKNPYAKNFIQAMDIIYHSVNLFEILKVNSFVEIVLTCVTNEYKGKGVFKKLCEAAFQLAQRCYVGENVRISVDDQPIPTFVMPTAAVLFPTTYASIKMAERYGFKIACTIDLQSEKSICEALTIKMDPIPVYYVKSDYT